MADEYRIKLVRDRIAEVDTSEGIAYRPVRDHDEHVELLKLKLGEELAEYLLSGSLQELIDVFEVLRALANVAHNRTFNELESYALLKHDQRGGFTGGTVMVTIEPEEGTDV